MLVSEIKVKKNGNPIMQQKCKIICDQCNKEFDRVYNVINKFRNKYNGNDLCAFCIRSNLLIARNKANTGKTYEQIYGKNKALEMKKIKSIHNSGKRNPNYKNKSNGAKGLVKFGKSCIGKTYEEIYGLKKAKIIKKKLSELNSGKNNNMYGKPSPIGSGNGWSGWYNGIYFRSILELSYLKYLFDNNIKFENGEKHDYKIQYELDGKIKNYFPDFYLIDTEELVEIKPYNLISSKVNSTKFEACKKIYGEKFKVITEKDIVKLDFETIYYMYINNQIKFIERYEKKFKEMVKEKIK